jgi:small subunit ribosomal protein S21
MKHGVPDFGAIKLIRDGLTIQVRDNDVEGAIRLLKRRMATDGTLRRLKSRELNPKKSDRSKIKAARSERHRSRHAARRAASDSRDTR